jgi:hypothetical protein
MKTTLPIKKSPLSTFINIFVANRKLFAVILLLCIVSTSGYAQKKGGNGPNNKDIEPVVYCVKDLGNGLHQARFGYENPSNKEVIINENDSKVKYNNGKKVGKGLAKFKPGSNDYGFTKEFGSHDYVEWTIISNGKSHTVIANANSAKKCAPDDGFIFPVIGNGKSENIIGQELTSLCDQVAGESPIDLIFQTIADKVLVEIVPIDGQMQNVISLLQGAQFMVPSTDFLLDIASYNNLAAVDVYIEKSRLCDLNLYNNIINFARPVYPAYTNSGGVLSQGDAAQTSNLVRESFRIKDSSGAIVPVDGAGITVGVLSDSYDMAVPGISYAEIDVANGELPEGVNIIKDNELKATDEGRAMMQIIHDVAPGAALQFHTATASPRQFEVGFSALAQESDIIVDDITFITEPFFGKGRISKAIQSFVSQPGKFHFTSAGNVANKGFQSTFSSTSSVPVTDFIPSGSPTRAHLFDGNGGTDYLQEISVVPGTYLIALQWKEDVASQENSSGAVDDLDIYIVDDLGRLLVGSNRINIAGDPTEIIVFRATGSGNANILITSANGSTSVPFRYIAFRTTAEDGTPDGLKFEEYFNNGAPTVSGHAMTPQSVTVGAVDYRKAANPIAETFSSFGGLLSDGTNLEVDLYAPDGANTSSTTIGQDANCSTCDNDGILNFYGTSAAAPHAAAAAALLMSAAPSWYPDGSYTAVQALQAFKTSATSFSAADGSSAGFINTLATFKSIAAQTTKITELIVEDGKTPSAEPFIVTIIGEFFPENQEDVSVLFNGQTLENIAYTTSENGSTVITATVPKFSGNPKLEVIVKSTTPGGTDGGASEPAYFFDEGKIALNIIANNAQFEYGQDINPSYYRPDSSQPDFTSSFTVQGLPEGVTFELLALQDGLPAIQLNNSAIDRMLAESGYPTVSEYVITPSFGDALLTEEQLAKYQINFISGYVDSELGKIGYLTITKKDLRIVPTSVTSTYGDIIEVELNYEYNSDGITDNNDFLQTIKNAHKDDFYAENTLIVINKLRAVVNEQQILDLLGNGSWMTSDRVIQNKLRAVVNGMNLIDLEPQHFDDYLNTDTDPITNKLRAVVNKLRAVVNGQNLLNNNIDLFDPINNKLRAVVNGTGINSGDSFDNFSEIFAVIDAEDGSTDTEERTINKFYSINLLSAMEVVLEGEESPKTYPGAFISPISVNFNVSYINGDVTFLPKDLNSIIESIELPYGEELTVEKLDMITDFEGWAFEGDFQESVETVFSDGVPYYFIKVGGDGTQLELNELKEIGDYEVKVRNPQNYVIANTKDETHGIITISPTVLTAETANFETVYGENFESSNLTTVFGDFAYPDESSETVFPNGVPYYFVDMELNEYEIGDKMNVGTYKIKIRGTENYLMEYGINHGSLTVTPAPLTVKTAEIEIEYGDDLKAAISTLITGFVKDETVETVFSDGISYLFVDGLNVELDIEAVRELGIYTIKVLEPTATANYEILYASDHGTLIISPRHVLVKTDNLNEDYGYTIVQSDLKTEFLDFAPGEIPEDVFGSSAIPYYFVDASGLMYTIGDELEAGDYEIKIEETNSHYIFEFDSSVNVLSIKQKALLAFIDDLILNVGETPLFTARFEGFVYGETEAFVFPEGVPYYIVDDSGYERDYNDAGVYTIKIRDTKNYLIDSNDAKLYMNPSYDGDKIRTYSECVGYDPTATDGLYYTVTYRYENNNDDPIFVLMGADNNLSGPAQFEGQLPTVFLPGSGTFEIRFNGKKLVWSLTTYGSTHKSSVSSASTTGSGKCDAKLDSVYDVFPNPVTSSVDYKLTIKQNIREESNVKVINRFGATMLNTSFDGSNEIIKVDMALYPIGMYFIRISNASDVMVFSIIKE